jgi:cytochrome c-type biogenesis protein CcmE
MTRKRQRLIVVLLALLLGGGATALVLSAFSDNLVFFYSPTDLETMPVPGGRSLRIGGLVEVGCVKRDSVWVTVHFTVTDLKTSVPVTYRGVLPDLFREGQGVVVEGTLAAGGAFTARSVLAKHDEKYMPREVAEALKKSGEWRGEDATTGATTGAATAGATAGATP